MAKKNRAARFSDFKAGVTMYEAGVSGEISTYYIQGRPRPYRLSDSYIPMRVVYKTASSFNDDLHEGHLFLSDHGISTTVAPSYKPPRLFLSHNAALKGSAAVIEYHTAYMAKNAKLFEYDDYGDDYVEDSEEIRRGKITEYQRYYMNDSNIATGFVHDVASTMKYESSHVPIRLYHAEFGMFYYGCVIDSLRVRLDYYASKESPFDITEVEHERFLRRFNGVWYSINCPSDWVDKGQVNDKTCMHTPWQVALESVSYPKTF